MYIYRSQLFRLFMLLSITAALFCMMVFSSCVHKDIEWPSTTHLSVEFDWGRASGAEVDGMTLYFFPADSHSKLWRFDIAGGKGGPLELPPGHYSLIAVNNDLRGVTFSGTDSYSLLQANARPYAADTLTLSTGMLYAASFPSVRVGYSGVDYTDSSGRNVTSPEGIIRAFPDSLATVYHIRIDSVSGAERIRSARAVLCGVAASVAISSCANSSASCAADFAIPLTGGATSTTLTTSEAAFGVPDIPTPQFTLRIVVTTAHAVYEKNFDVTGQVLNSGNNRNVYIHISGINIPAADSPSGDPDVGINVGVDGWQVIEITYS